MSCCSLGIEATDVVAAARRCHKASFTGSPAVSVGDRASSQVQIMRKNPAKAGLFVSFVGGTTSSGPPPRLSKRGTFPFRLAIDRPGKGEVRCDGEANGAHGTPRECCNISCLRTLDALETVVRTASKAQDRGSRWIFLCCGGIVLNPPLP